jgi:hypothetical protein
MRGETHRRCAGFEASEQSARTTLTLHHCMYNGVKHQYHHRPVVVIEVAEGIQGNEDVADVRVDQILLVPARHHQQHTSNSDRISSWLQIMSSSILLRVARFLVPVLGQYRTHSCKHRPVLSHSGPRSLSEEDVTRSKFTVGRSALRSISPLP